MTLNQLRDFWWHYWLQPTSPASVCVLRILLGILIVVSTLMFLPESANYFGPQGLVSENSINRYHGEGHFSLLFLLPRTDSSVSAVLYCLLLSSICMALGLHTRATTVIAFVCLVSLHHRNPLIMNGGDTLLRVLCFLMIFAPAGAMYSLDALNSRKKSPAPPLHAPWAQRLIELQICALYCQAFWCKAMGDDWVNGDAVFYATHMPEYVRFGVPSLLDNIIVLKLMTWGALFIEFAFWTFIWVKELRYWVLALGIALHCGIEFAMNIPLFELIIMASYMAFIPGQATEAAVQMLHASAKRTFGHGRARLLGS